jgi:hypothetical protein
MLSGALCRRAPARAAPARRPGRPPRPSQRPDRLRPTAAAPPPRAAQVGLVAAFITVAVLLLNAAGPIVDTTLERFPSPP